MSKIYTPINHQFTAEASNTFVAYINGNHVSTMNDFYTAISKALNFPDYFGENLDALDEMLYDMDWIEQDFILLLILQSNEMLKEDSENKNKILNLMKAIDNPYFEIGLL